MNATTPRPLLVVGAGIAGVTAALEAAEAGHQVVLIDREPAVGGRVLRHHRYFPKMCPPACGMEVNIQRLERSRRVRALMQTELVAARRDPHGWSVTLASAPAYVGPRCTACGECSQVCPAAVADPHNLGMSRVPAIRLPHGGAWPRQYVLDRSACPEGCRKCVEACKCDAIDLGAQPGKSELEAGAIVLCTGWQPYPIEKLPELGGGELQDVIANVQLERLGAADGPTQGKILRPSDGQAPRAVAFVQCAGSRDVNHLPYCSGICCQASLKQALYVREQLPECAVTIYYIDRRTPGRAEDLLARVTATAGVNLIKGKVGRIEASDGGQLVLRVEDVEAGRLLEAKADLVVLATGMVPNLREGALGLDLRRDEDGFGLDDLDAGVLVAGVARRPEDVAACVRDATGAAAKAIVAAASCASSSAGGAAARGA
ncbi:MAG: CoB--CoM heterodisulfide reductase iron-sulfur subunit A family protein [Deltaproteobacteria bacterium]|nr:CoB--CoM heterodisulfide reductase iron-sulfur subunit A family protein [Deltaproteobacteria bacterium]